MSLGYATEAWVLAKFYATEAWVLEWVTPLNVTGTLDPDATCTYHKAGTLNCQPYYIRDDGAWFLWWDGDDTWFISEELEVEERPLWYRENTSILGEYTAASPATGVATVASGYGCPHLCFVDRGDPADIDYEVGDLTQDGNWHELDLSGIVPAGAKAVLISFKIASPNINREGELRTAGNVNTASVSIIYTLLSGFFICDDSVVPLDSNRKIEYRFNNTVWFATNITVKGWCF